MPSKRDPHYFHRRVPVSLNVGTQHVEREGRPRGRLAADVRPGESLQAVRVGGPPLFHHTNKQGI
eukprot:6388040-Prorocentrum_lima.AAC.1